MPFILLVFMPFVLDSIEGYNNFLDFIIPISIFNLLHYLVRRKKYINKKKYVDAMKSLKNQENTILDSVKEDNLREYLEFVFENFEDEEMR